MTLEHTSSFADRFAVAAEQRSPFCLGIDPSAAILGETSLEGFCHALTETLMKEPVALVKPQSAYFERFGAHGAAVLQQMIHTLRAADMMVLLDGKRGDIAATNQAYAEAFFAPAAPMAVDAITAHAFLGFDDLAPLFTAAEAIGGMVFVMVASSNLAGRALQSAQIEGRSLIEILAEQIAAQPAAGAVVGATRDDLTRETLARFGDSLLLCPGIGAQGAAFSSFSRFPDKSLIIPTASRALLQAPSFIEALKQHKGLAFRHLRS